MIAGIFGGIAEVLWIALYQCLAGDEAADVARGVAGSLDASLAASSLAVPLGIAAHMGLAMVLGVAIAATVRPVLLHLGKANLEPVCVVGILVAVWATNFFIVLPVINPDFVQLVPYEVSLVSKVLFGLAAASALSVSSAGEREAEDGSRKPG